MRDIYHVARADFVQRVSSRRLLAVLAFVAYLGYLVNVGDIELVYQHEVARDRFRNYYGEPTAAFVGAKTALTGTFFLLIGGFYLLKNAVERDRSTGVDRLVASTPISDRRYLLGKWLSNVALAVVVLATLGGAAAVNHVVHGVGPTDPVALLVPLFVLGVPFGGVVGAVSLVFETTDRLDGTLGNVVYFVVGLGVLTAPLATAEGALPEAIPLTLKLLDGLGVLAVYEATADPLLSVRPSYPGGPPSFGQVVGGATDTYRWTGGTWPSWMYLQRLGFVAAGLALVGTAALPFDRYDGGESNDGRGRLGALVSGLPFVGRESTGDESEPPAVGDVSPTEVTDRDAGGFVRLVFAELRLALRGQRWWWYAGAVGLLVVGAVDVPTRVARQVVLPLAFVWPIFVWSPLGVRTARHRVTPLVLSSKRPLGQLLAEWLAGVVVAAALGAGVTASLAADGHTGVALGAVGAAVFAPSLAVAAGSWSRSSRLFEILYLVLWYVGPVNRVPPLDFVGVTSAAVSMGVPAVFAGVGVLAVLAALVRRRREV